MGKTEVRTHEKSAQASAGGRCTATKLFLGKQVVRTLAGQELGAVAGGQGVNRPLQHPR